MPSQLQARSRARPHPLGLDWETGPLPAVGGRYLLLLSLPATTSITVRSGKRFDLQAGAYAYVGSAAGPGGLAARVGRHLRSFKGRHWHIDHLLVEAMVQSVICFGLEAEECALARWLLSLPGASAITGFGNSDCACRSHLLALGEAAEAGSLASGSVEAGVVPDGAVLGVWSAVGGPTKGPP